MSAPDSPQLPRVKPKTRRDGWTPERQLRFLANLAETKCVTRAAAAAGMSREGAYRLRSRADCGLFAALWDGIMRPDFGNGLEVHGSALSDGRLARLLGICFRRERGDFSAIAHWRKRRPRGDRARTL